MEELMPKENANDKRCREEYGFTNHRIWIDRVIAWRDAAVADGWSIEPTYGSESVDRACSLHKDGFKAMLLTRDNSGQHRKYTFEASINVWGPDGLAIHTSDVYDWEKIKAGTTTCNACGATGVKTERYSFAGRCCEKCLPAMRQKHEYPGWCN